MWRLFFFTEEGPGLYGANGFCRLRSEAIQGWMVGLGPADFDRPYGTGALYITTQALRAWLRSPCPSGTKAIRQFGRF
jgi:hypothetical protein